MFLFFSENAWEWQSSKLNYWQPQLGGYRKLP